MNIRDADELRDFVKDGSIEAVDLKYCDLNGRWHHITLPARSLGDDLLERGVGFDGSSVPGFSKLESGDLVLIPDPPSAFLDPFWDVPTMAVLCDVVEADTRKPYPRDPRGIARRAEQFLLSSGMADLSLWGPEFEFYLFDRVSVENGPLKVRAEIEVFPPSACDIPQRDKNSYHQCPPTDRGQELRAAVCRGLERCGVLVNYHHHEVGRFGQNEIEVERVPLLQAGDVVFMVKHFVRMTAARMGMTATFMPKPLFGEAGSGMHFHQHLFAGETPVFYDPSGYAGMSKKAMHYVAGLLDHGRALSALTNPSTNSFKRLIPGFEAPVNLFFSLANRSAAVRIPKYADAAHEKRIEFRPPDGTCNPYVAMAAQLMAGLDGMKRELDPTACGFGPFDEDIFRWTAERRKSILPLPHDLDEAFGALLDDDGFLLEGGVFDRELIDTFVRMKRETDLQNIARRPHPMEIELYYDA